MGAILQVPQEIEFRTCDGAFTEAALQCQGLLDGKHVLEGVLRELMQILFLYEPDGIGQGLTHLVVEVQVGHFLLLLGAVLHRHRGSHDVRQLKLPRSQPWHVLLIDQIDPPRGDGLILARLSVDHVLDEILNLYLFLGVQLNGVFLFLLAVLLIILLVLFLIILFILFVLFIFVLVLILFVFLIFLLLLLLHGWHKLTQNILNVLDAILVHLLITEFRQLGLCLFQLGSHHPEPEPVGEGQG
mmetsp:Transcript_30229/g.65214  ORF Transcript_30229/g.65214 Transcript_30229/m.65214 type:complete len:243 (-) Transcript_30229:716-1444(-)